jgi:hypothetical protein
MGKIPCGLNMFLFLCSIISNLKHLSAGRNLFGYILSNIKVVSQASFVKAKMLSKYLLLVHKLRTQTSSMLFSLPSTISSPLLQRIN